MAAARPAGPDVQAEVPDRCRQRADRRRAARARRRASSCASPPRGWATGCLTRLTCRWPSAIAALLSDVTWRLGPGQRVALVGANGSGKTTLMRLLAGDRVPDSGEVDRGATVRLAELSQDTTELPPGLRVVEALERGPRPRDDERRGGADAGDDGGAVRLSRRETQRSYRGPLRWRAPSPSAHARAPEPSPTCCCSTSRPTTWTSTPSPRSRTCSTAGPGRSSSSPTTGTSSSGSATTCSR